MIQVVESDFPTRLELLSDLECIEIYWLVVSRVGLWIAWDCNPVAILSDSKVCRLFGLVDSYVFASELKNLVLVTKT